ncbi:antichymotrypsin-2-like [Tenebrio molitor]|uniref:antichymotrypsin-2-like n=1 Tax=Tenebrio molitor TaxID=7067 RepID=UPI0036249628
MKCLTIFLLSVFLALAENGAVQEFTKANNLFTPAVYKQISLTKKGNFLVSSLSAETVLALLQSGCKDETAQELRTALHLPDDKETVESAIKSLLPKLKGSDLYTLHTANKIYVKEDFSIKDGFKKAAAQIYYADTDTIDFTQSVQAAKTMNSWVEKHTNDKIHNLIDSNLLDQYTRAVLINALYFKANWSSPFLLAESGNITFYKTATDIVQVDALRHFEVYFNYYECPHLKAEFLELPFKGNEASMMIVLPKERDGLAALENQIENVFAPMHTLKTEYLNVFLPKFRIESSLNFKNILKNLGVKKIFDAKEADLSGVAGKKGDLIVDEVVQKTFIDVSEEGVEAAAATFVLIAVPESATIESPKNFIADHPFIFYIKVKDTIIFAGRVTDPKH